MPSLVYTAGYKYQLNEDYTIQLPHPLRHDSTLDVVMSYYTIGVDGLLTIKSGYAWDGCSGPTADDESNMRAGLVHDCLYQAMKEGVLSKDNRKHVDSLFRRILIEDGMPSFRAWYYYTAVRSFGGNYLHELKASEPNFLKS
jgi:hypothetical protein